MQLYFLKIRTRRKSDIPPLIYFPVERPTKAKVKKDVCEILERYLSTEKNETAHLLPTRSIKGGICSSEKGDEKLWEASSLAVFLNQLDEWEKAGT